MSCIFLELFFQFAHNRWNGKLLSMFVTIIGISDIINTIYQDREVTGNDLRKALNHRCWRLLVLKEVEMLPIWIITKEPPHHLLGLTYAIANATLGTNYSPQRHFRIYWNRKNEFNICYALIFFYWIQTSPFSRNIQFTNT